MSLNISRLRRGLAVAGIAAVAVVAGAYFYAQHRVQNGLKEVPERIATGIQQSANGFTYSGSDGAHTLFKIQASKAVQFKKSGVAELHDVAITVYGKDSTRFDQIYGADFEFDPRSGDVIAKSEVQIDLEANPAGLKNPDQTPPKELKNPIHLKTSGLVFNQKTGDASTKETVDFNIPQASGSTVGMSYSAKTSTLTLQSQVNIVLNGATPAILTAARGIITKESRQIVLEQAHLRSGARRAEADQATLYLKPDNTLNSVLASGNVLLHSEGAQPAQIRAAQLELILTGRQSAVQSAVFSGGVYAQTSGPERMHASADRAVFNFAGKNTLTKVHTEGNVRLQQRQKPSPSSANAQDLELTAATADFFLAAGGRRLARAETPASAQIAIRPLTPGAEQTLITAATFLAQFDAQGRLKSVDGMPDARIISSVPGHSDRVSTSTQIDAGFHPGKGIEFIVQQGNFVYVDGDRKAWADSARYTPADQILNLTGSPRVVQGGLSTTAISMRLNRSSRDASAEGDVKSTYNDLKLQSGGALLSSSSPIHVTAHSMTLHRASAVAVYSGNARLWQDANVVEAPTIEFNREQRSMLAYGLTPSDARQTVSTVLVQADKNGKTTPVTVTSARLAYADSERKAHFEGGVLARAADFTVTAAEMEVFLQARGQSTNGQPASSQPASQSAAKPAKLESIIAQGQVVVTQPARRATGDKLIYTASEDKFVMTGGPPSIFDAEHGKITGVSLTLFRTDDRVLVEGTVTSPSITQTRVAR